jgi:hypothetical protein
LTKHRDGEPINYALATNLALEAYAVSGGKRNPSYAVARALRLRGYSEVVTRIPGTQRFTKQVVKTMTAAEEALLDRALASTYRRDVMKAIRREVRSERFLHRHAEDFADLTESSFEREWKSDADRRRANYLERTRPIRALEEKALWHKPGAAEAIERWAGCVCFGTGYIVVSDAEGESGDIGAGRRVRCEVCQRRERDQRQALEEQKRNAELLDWLLDSFAKQMGVSRQALLESRKLRREVVNIIVTVYAGVTGLTQAEIANVTGWSEPTVSKSVNGVKKTWPELGLKSSSALPSADGYQGSAPSSAGVVSSTAPASLPEQTFDRTHKTSQTQVKEPAS